MSDKIKEAFEKTRSDFDLDYRSFKHGYLAALKQLEPQVREMLDLMDCGFEDEAIQRANSIFEAIK